MADNTTVDAPDTGDGDTFAFDDIGGVKYQRVKLIHGADGTNDGDVSSVNGLPVAATLSAVDNAVLDAIQAAVEAIETAVEGTLTVSGTVAVTGVATAAKQDTQTTALQAIETAVEALQVALSAGGTEVDVNIVADGAGLATDAKLDTIIGHVDGLETLITATNALLTTIDGDTGTLAVTGNGTSAGALRVTVSSDSTGLISVDDNGGSLTVDDGGTSLTVDGTVSAIPTAGTSGGWTPYHLVSAATTNATNVKASAGQVGYIVCSNVNAAARYLKLYDDSGTPDVGTDTPVHTFIIPGNTAGAGIVVGGVGGIEFANGIAFALTTLPADDESTGVAAEEIVVNLGYA